MEHDLDFESHRLFNRVSRVPSIDAESHVYDDGHDWDVWEHDFVEDMIYLRIYLSTGDDSVSTLD